ncbi:MAG: hypothetical protein IMZ61_00750 [Planctomycetes bacterium]|nr:hypothetical protein [Planctomycetota bacterium]
MSSSGAMCEHLSRRFRPVGMEVALGGILTPQRSSTMSAPAELLPAPAALSEPVGDKHERVFLLVEIQGVPCDQPQAVPQRHGRLFFPPYKANQGSTVIPDKYVWQFI